MTTGAFTTKLYFERISGIARAAASAPSLETAAPKQASGIT
jgi:hypothetical protein